MYRKNIDEYVGKTFGRLIILSDSGWVKSQRRVSCICLCGSIREYDFFSLKRGNVKSCGCIRKEKPNTTTHNLCKHPLYFIYMDIKARCYNSKNPAYCNYGAIGVVMCEEWLNDFVSFYNWALSNGWQKGVEIDKDKLAIKNRGKIYSPEFCSILTRKENGRYKKNNVLITYKGQEKCLSEWCELLELNVHSIYTRITAGGMSYVEALEKPIRKKMVVN